MVATAELPRVAPRPQDQQAGVEAGRREGAPSVPKAPSTASPTAARPRLALLDGLRLVAALAVLLFHWTAWHHGNWGRHGEPAAEAWPWLSQFTAVGALGVQLFFIISGFVILLSAFGKSPAKFIGSRVGRLYPAYWVAVLASSALIFLIWPELGSRRQPSDIWANLTMFQGGLGVGHIDGVYWTLWVEMKFYLWILAFTLIGMTVRRVLIFAAAWPVLGNGLFFGLRASGEQVGWVEHVFFPEYSALFAGGMALFLLYRFGHTPGRWVVLLLNVALACPWSARIQRRETANLTGYDYPLELYMVIVAAMFAVVALLVLTPLASMRVPGATFAGTLTYPVYLIHQLWGWWVIMLLSPHLPKEWVLAIALGAVVATAWLVNRWVEVPLGPRLSRAVTAGVGRWPVVGPHLATVHGPDGTHGPGHRSADRRPARGVRRPALRGS